MVMWHIKLKEMVSRTGYKNNFYPRVKLVTLGWGQKVKYHSFQLQGQFQRFLYQTLCVFSQIKDTEHIKRKFHSVAWVMPQGWDLGVLGVKTFSVEICDGAPSITCSSF